MEALRGDPTGEKRLSQRIRREGGCLRWMGTHTSTGYGQMRLNGRAVGVHRVAYELAKGPIPDGLEIDHLCRVRDCVNPDHLEAVTHRENLRRSSNRYIRFDAMECVEGHPLSEDNLYLYPDGRRGCRACRRRATSDWKQVSGYASSTNCECGLTATPSNLARHRNSKRHAEAMTLRSNHAGD